MRCQLWLGKSSRLRSEASVIIFLESYFVQELKPAETAKRLSPIIFPRKLDIEESL